MHWVNLVELVWELAFTVYYKIMKFFFYVYIIHHLYDIVFHEETNIYDDSSVYLEANKAYLVLKNYLNKLFAGKITIF